MGNLLCYGLIIPEEWYLNFSKDQSLDDIRHHIVLLNKNGEKFENSRLQIGDVVTELKIFDIETCWWFARLGDGELNGRTYFFTKNLVSEMFPEFENDYMMNQTRRERQIIMDRFLTHSNNHYDYPDDGIELDENEFERLDDIKVFLKYKAIIPKIWTANLSIDEVVEGIGEKIARFMRDEEPIQNGVITIGNVPAILNIENEKFCWWFSLLGHTEPNIYDYEFTNDILNYGYPKLVEQELERLEEAKRLNDLKRKNNESNVREVKRKNDKLDQEENCDN